ncbi:MAG: 50S ribosomal protein L10 [Deltaproteobacteria bacterium]|mgnify:CR=1 FL=1
MEKKQKAAAIEDLRERFARSSATFIAEYKGIKAVEMNEFRKSLRKASMELKIVRNTLAQRAVKDTAFEAISDSLKGPTAIAFSFKDPALAAKTLTQFAKEQPNLKLKLATLGLKVLTVQQINGLADLPPREVLLGKLLGTLKSPAAGFVGVLSAVPRKLLYALNAVGQSKAAV